MEEEEHHHATRYGNCCSYFSSFKGVGGTRIRLSSSLLLLLRRFFSSSALSIVFHQVFLFSRSASMRPTRFKATRLISNGTKKVRGGYWIKLALFRISRVILVGRAMYKKHLRKTRYRLRLEILELGILRRRRNAIKKFLPRKELDRIFFKFRKERIRIFGIAKFSRFAFSRKIYFSFVCKCFERAVNWIVPFKPFIPSFYPFIFSS